MPWNRNDTRFDLDLANGDSKNLRLKKRSGIVPVPPKEEIFTSILHLSKQIQFYDSQAQTDGSLNRFFGNSLPLVLGHTTGESIIKSFRDLRNTVRETEHRWQRGATTLRRHRIDVYRSLSFQFESLEMLKNAAIAEQSEIASLCTSYPALVQLYTQVLSRWNTMGIVAQIRKLSIQLGQINRTFNKLESFEVPDFWYNQIREILNDIDTLEIRWKQLQIEAAAVLERIVSEQSLDPLTTIPFILGEIIEEFSQNQAQSIQERLSHYFLERRSGLNRFEIVPEEIYAKYEWNTESDKKSLPQGELFFTEEQDPDENASPLIALTASDNYPLNAQLILRTTEINCSHKVSTSITPDKVQIDTSFPSKFRLESLRQKSSSERTPFVFSLKSTLLNVWGNVVKWELQFEFPLQELKKFMEIQFHEQSGLKQSFGDDSLAKIWQLCVSNAFVIEYPTVEENAALIPSNTQLTVSTDDELNLCYFTWKTVLDADNPQPFANAKGEVLLYFTLLKDYAFLYPFFSHAKASKIHIKSQVLELQDIEIYNDFGKIDPSTPFNIFGTKPELGSKLFIGHPLVLCNALDHLKINAQWFGLPDYKGGFVEHYQGYDLINQNEDFLVRVSALNAGTWVPEEDNQVIPLFSNANPQSEGSDQSVSNIRRINELDLSRLQLNRKQKAYEPLKEPQKSKYGYICLELASPTGAFGHNRHTEYVQRKMGETKKTVYLNEPYTPLMGNLSMEAHMSEVIQSKDIASRLEVKGIDAFFLAKDFEPHHSLMPSDAFRSALYVQFDEFPDNSCSLYIEVPDGVSKGGSVDPKDWEILHNDNWETLGSEQFLRDETLNWETTGLVLLSELPSFDEESEKWIRISSKTDDIISQRKSIQTQVVKFDITASKNLLQIYQLEQIVISENWSDTLAILEPLQSKKIIPPSLYFGNTDLLTIQYRLQNRIFTYQDLKQSLLIKFPKIQETLILAHNNGLEEVAPGCVRVIVIPKTEPHKLQLGEWPQLNSQEIKTVQRFLEDAAPLGTHYLVENPVYEEIVVKGNIVIEAGIDTREARKIIHQTLLDGILDVTGVAHSGFTFKQNLYSSKVLVLLRNISFVKSVTNFACYTKFGEYLKLPKEFNSLNYQIEPSNVNHILIPGKQHLIDIKVSGTHNSDGIGVSNMTLGTDFLVDRLYQNLRLSGIGKHRIGMTLEVQAKPEESTKPLNQIRL